MDLHPDCAPLAFLIGTWKGTGSGDYPTIDPFRYREEVVFGHVGKPFLAYSQKTRHADTGEPLHAETGYLRAVGADQVEFAIVQPSGIVEMHVGSVQEKVLQLSLHSVQTTPAAKSVTDVRREVRVDAASSGDPVLVYDVFMAAVGQPMTHHLRAELLQQPTG